MTIRQSRYILAETEREKKVRVTEVQRAEEDPFIRKSEIQQTVNNSTLPVSSRAVNLAIESINSNLDLKADKTELEGLATEDYVNEKIDEKEIGITEPELISKSVGSGKWMREGAYGYGSRIAIPIVNSDMNDLKTSGNYAVRTNADASSVLNMPSRIAKKCFVQVFNGGMAGEVIQVVTDYLNTLTASRAYYAYGGIWSEWSYTYTESNTRTDKNNVLHSGTGTPINTLNVSDMADTVVDNDLLTVTSGAVFRAIKQLTDQITSLEARIRELEDGGV